MAKKDGEYIEFNEDELYQEITKARRGDIDDIVGKIDMEDGKVNRMSEEQIRLEKKGDRINTEMKKHQFIDEMKRGLGNRIKENPSEIKSIKHKVTFMDRVKEFFKKF